jgi:hypothetical protein
MDPIGATSKDANPPHLSVRYFTVVASIIRTPMCPLRFMTDILRNYRHCVNTVTRSETSTHAVVVKHTSRRSKPQRVICKVEKVKCVRVRVHEYPSFVVLFLPPCYMQIHDTQF